MPKIIKQTRRKDGKVDLSVRVPPSAPGATKAMPTAIQQKEPKKEPVNPLFPPFKKKKK